jgi:hypothetical protein
MNLVFDKWDDDGNPIQNFNHINLKFGKQLVTYPSFMSELRDENFYVKNCRLSDVNENENFYYVISYLDECLFFVKNGKIDFSKEVEYNITHNNLKIIFITTHESPENLFEFITILKNNISKNNWKEDNFYIISNDSMLGSIKKELNTNINFYKINSLLKLVSSEPTIQPNVDDILYDKKFIFLLQNRLPHEHRILLLTYLKYLNVLENDITNWSLLISTSQYLRNNRIFSMQNSFEKINTKYIDTKNKKLISYYKELCNTKKLGYYEMDINELDYVTKYEEQTALSLQSFKNSYINIISETHFNRKKNNLHITEKSFKPFYYFQLPIFVAQYNHVKMIRDEYEFDLFDDLIDHSYDTEKDDVKRFHMVVKEIHRLSNMREEIHNYYKDNIDRILHNYEYVKSYPTKKIDENYFLNL